MQEENRGETKRGDERGDGKRRNVEKRGNNGTKGTINLNSCQK